jgi:outer membrane immunogenic protein
MSSHKSLACLLTVSTVLSASIAHAGGPAAATTEPEVAAAAPAKSIWSGAWVGLSFGQGSGNYDIAASVNDSGTHEKLLSLNLPDHGAKGSLMGLELGYGRQLNDKWVAGVQVDGTSTNITLDTSISLGDNSALYQLKQKSLLSGLGRLGYLTSEDTLVYGLLGVTNGTFEGSYSATDGIDTVGSSYDFSATGLTIGAGMETRLSSRTSLKLEYRMTDFGDYNLAHEQIGGDTEFNADMGTTAQSFRATVVMHF